MDVDFGNIIKRSFEVAWRYKTLWIFGLFAGGGGSLNFNWMDNLQHDRVGSNFAYDFFDSMDMPPRFYDVIPPELALVSMLIVWMLALGLLFFIGYLIAQPAIIDGVNKITRGGQYRFGTSFSRGADFFWRFLGITMVEIFLGIFALFIIIITAIVLHPITLLMTIPAGIVTLFFAFHVFGLAEIAMVARDNHISDAIGEGWNLLMHNKVNCLIMSLLLIALGIGFTIVILMATFFVYLPINLLVYWVTGDLVGILMLAVFIGLPVALVLGGYSGTFFNALYVQFYFRLVEPRPIPAIATPVERPGPATG